MTGPHPLFFSKGSGFLGFLGYESMHQNAACRRRLSKLSDNTLKKMMPLPTIPDEIIRIIKQHVHASLRHRMILREIRDLALCGVQQLDWTRGRRGLFILDRIDGMRNDCCECDSPTNYYCSHCKLAFCGECMYLCCTCGRL